MIRGYRLVVLVGLFLTAPLGAQISDSEARALAKLPDPPSDHLLDVGGLFERHPERRQIISERLLKMETEHDLPVYVAVYAGLIDSTLSRRARLLYDKWIGPDRDGLLLVYNTDTREREIVTPRNGHASLRDGEGILSRLPAYQMIPILAELRATLKGVEDRVDFLDRTTEILVARLDELLRERPAATGDRFVLGLVAVVLVIGLVLTLFGVFANRRLREADERVRERFYFPEVTVGIRLGAPFCGGRLSVVDFSRNQNRAAK